MAFKSDSDMSRARNLDIKEKVNINTADKITLDLMDWVIFSPYDIAIPNFYFARNEMDVFKLEAGTQYVIEYEIKCSKADYERDFDKVSGIKHRNFAKGFGLPNKFYFVVVEGIVCEVPEYAGLVYWNKDGLKVIKEAPLMHDRKQDIYLYQKLCHELALRNTRLVRARYKEIMKKEVVEKENKLKREFESDKRIEEVTSLIPEF